LFYWEQVQRNGKRATVKGKILMIVIVAPTKKQRSPC